MIATLLLLIVAVIVVVDALLLKDCTYNWTVPFGKRGLLTVGWYRFTWTVGVNFAGLGIHWADTRQVMVNVGPLSLTVDFLGG